MGGLDVGGGVWVVTILVGGIWGIGVGGWGVWSIVVTIVVVVVVCVVVLRFLQSSLSPGQFRLWVDPAIFSFH